MLGTHSMSLSSLCPVHTQGPFFTSFCPGCTQRGGLLCQSIRIRCCRCTLAGLVLLLLPAHTHGFSCSLPSVVAGTHFFLLSVLLQVHTPRLLFFSLPGALSRALQSGALSRTLPLGIKFKFKLSRCSLTRTNLRLRIVVACSQTRSSSSSFVSIGTQPTPSSSPPKLAVENLCNALICLQLATHRASSYGTHGVVTHSRKTRFLAHRTSCC